MICCLGHLWQRGWFWGVRLLSRSLDHEVVLAEWALDGDDGRGKEREYEPEQQAGDFGDRARASGHQADTANDAENDATHLAMAIISTAIPCAA